MPCRRASYLPIASLALLASIALVVCGCNSAPGEVEREPVASPTPSDAEYDRAEQTVATTRPKLKPGAKTVALERAGTSSRDKTFDDLRFDIEPGDPFTRGMLPESVEALDGQPIRIRGYILPTPQKRGIKTFVLVRDNQECCFGPGAALYDCILVEMRAGKTAEFSIRPVAVEGTFSIREFRGPDGTHLAIYHIEGESVR